MFSSNRGNGPETISTRMFRPVRQIPAPVGRQTTLFGRDRRVANGNVAVPGTRSATSDCVLLMMTLQQIYYAILSAKEMLKVGQHFTKLYKQQFIVAPVFLFSVYQCALGISFPAP